MDPLLCTHLIRMAASRVLYVDRVPCGWGEAELRGFLAPYGGVCRVVFLRRHNALFAAYDPVTLACNTHQSMLQALVETQDLDTAARIVHAMPNIRECVDGTMDADCNGGITVSYSRNQELRDQRSATDRHRRTKQQRKEQFQHPESAGAIQENHILLVTVQNPTYPITTNLMYSVCSPYGRVEKIVVFVKRVGVQCLVQFATISEAKLARDMLTGLSIFPDCCGLVLNYSNLPVGSQYSCFSHQLILANVIVGALCERERLAHKRLSSTGPASSRARQPREPWHRLEQPGHSKRL